MNFILGHAIQTTIVAQEQPTKKVKVVPDEGAWVYFRFGFGF